MSGNGGTSKGNDSKSSLRSVCSNEESLAVLLNGMKDFEQKFCGEMMAGTDFTIVMEVRGNVGEQIHCRVKSDSFRRPHGVEKLVEGKVKSP